MKTKLSSRIMALLLCMVMCISLVPAQVFAEEADFNGATEEEASAEEATDSVESEAPSETGNEPEEINQPEETVANAAAMAETVSSGTSGSIAWVLDDEGTLTITGSGAMSNYSSTGMPWNSNKSSICKVIIESGVTSVGNYAFYNCTSLSSVSLPDTVTTIGNYAFYNCSSLTEMILPESLTTLGYKFISGCSGITEITIPKNMTTVNSSGVDGPLSGSAVKKVIFEDGTATIQNYMLSGATEVESVTIPSSVTKIGNRAFFKCSSLREITIPEGVTDIVFFAFSGCTSLTELILPESLTNLGYAFISGCTGITEITIPKNITTADTSSNNGPLYGSSVTKVTFEEGATAIPNYLLSGATAVESVTIPSTVTSIGSYAFNKCSGLTEITIPESVTSIGSSAFLSCTGLTQVSIPEGVTSISSLFSGCTNLASVSLPDSLKTIGNGAFSNCSSLAEITIPEGVTGIESNAFSGCTGLTGITLPESLKTLGYKFISGCTGITEITIPKNVTSAGSYSDVGPLGGSSVTKVTFEDGTTAIRNYILAGATTVETVTIPSTVTSVGNYAFYNCSSLPSVSLPDALTSIGYYAFNNCTGLSEIAIPSNVTSIGYCAFSGCTGFTEITLPESLKTLGYKFISGCTGITEITIPKNVTYAGDSSLNGPLSGSSVTKVTFEDGITAIQNYILAGAATVETVTIPSTVTSVGNYAFYNCSALTSVSLPDALTSIGNYAFNNCTGLSEIAIPSNVTSIGYCAFSGCTGFTEITLPESLKTLGYKFISGCTGITELTIPKNLTTAGYFQNCGPLNGSSVTTVTFEDGTTAVPDYILAGAATVESVSLPAGVTSIGNYAFYNCTGLTHINIPEGVISIGSYAFYNCSSLTECSMPASATSFGDEAFYNCPAFNTPDTISGESNGLNWTMVISTGTLTISGSCAMASYDTDSTPWDVYKEYIERIIVESGVTSIGDYAFCNCPNLSSVSVPDTVTSIGENAFSECTGLTELILPESVTTLGPRFIYGCTGITEITIPKSVTTAVYSNYNDYRKYNYYYHYGPFAGSSVSRVTFEDGTPAIISDILAEANTVKNVTIPATVTSIGSHAFYNCCSLQEIDIPEGVTSVDEYAFYGCSSLTELVLPESVTSLGVYIISGCTGITEITIPQSVTNIDYQSNNLDYEGPLSGSSVTKVTFEDGTATILSCMLAGAAKVENVTIPETVTSIEDRAFMNCTGLTELNIPESVTSLGFEIISGCTGLTKLTIPKSVTSVSRVGSFDGSSLKKVILEAGTTEILNYTFYNATTVESVIIPDTVLRIGSYAFYKCSSLSVINIPESVTQIDDCAFFGCTGLTELVLPENLTTLGNRFISGCTGITKLYIPTGITKAGSGILDDDRYGPLSGSAVKKVTFETGTTEIAGCILENATTVESVTIPSTVKSIGYGAFYNCSNLSGINLPKSVTTIGEQAFSKCTGITKITLPGRVESIGSRAFAGCTGLAELILPESVTSLGDYMISGCTGLTEITIPKNVTSAGSGSDFHGGSLYGSSVTELTFEDGLKAVPDYIADGAAMLTSVTIPSTVTRIGNHAFCGCSLLETIELPQALISIGAYAFGSCSSLSEITIPSTVTGIGDYAFIECSALRSVNLSQALTTIGDYAFDNCGNLPEISIPEGVTKIGSFAFSGCTGLTEMNLPENLADLGYSFIDGCTGIVEITLPKSLEEQSSYHSYNGPLAGSSVKKVTFEYGTVIILGYLLSGADALEGVIIPETVEEIRSYAFYGCPALSTVIFRGNKPVFPDIYDNDTDAVGYYPAGDTTWYGIEGYYAILTWRAYTGYMDYDAGSGTGTTTGSTTVISGQCGPSAYYSLDSNSTLTIHGTGATYDWLETAAAPWHDYCDSIQCVYIKDGITGIGNYAFYNCNNVTSVIMGSTVTTIGEYAFYCCSALSTVSLPLNLTDICKDAFASCGLTSVIIPAAVTEIGAEAFSGCKSLTQIQILSDATKICDSVFLNCTALNKITFKGNAPSFDSNAFYSVSLTAYYPFDDLTWTESVMQNYGGFVVWVATGNTEDDEVTVDKDSYYKTIGYRSFYAYINDWEGQLFDPIVSYKVQVGDQEFTADTETMYLGEAVKADVPDDYTGNVVITREGYHSISIPAAYTDMYNKYMMYQSSYTDPFPEALIYQDNDGYFDNLMIDEVMVNRQPIKNSGVLQLCPIIDWNGHTPGKVWIQQGSEDSDFTDESSRTYLTENVLYDADVLHDYIPNETVYLCLSYEGTTILYPLQLKIKEQIEKDTISIDFGEEEVDVPTGDLNYLWGESLEWNFNDLSGDWLPVNLKLNDDQTFEGVIGCTLGQACTEKDVDNSYKSIKEYFSAAKAGENFNKVVDNMDLDELNQSMRKEFGIDGVTQKTANIAGAKGRIEIVGIISGDYTMDEMRIKDIELMLIIYVEGSKTFQFVFPNGLPGYFKVTLSDETKIPTTVLWNAEEQKIEFEKSPIESTIQLEFGVGTGWEGWLSLGGQGTGKLEAECTIPLDKEDFTATFSANFAVTGTVMGLEGTWEIVSTPDLCLYKNGEWFPDDDSTVTNEAGLAFVPLEETITHDSAFAAVPESTKDTDYPVLKTDTNTFSNPQLADFDDGTKLLVWLDDVPGRETIDAPGLYYSYFDGTTWSEPTLVWDDGTNDYNPSLVVDGDNVYILWQNYSKTFGASYDSMDSIADQVNVAVAVFSHSDNAVNDKHVFDAAGYDQLQQMNISGDSVCVAWYNGVNKDTVITAEYTDGTWTEPAAGTVPDWYDESYSNIPADYEGDEIAQENTVRTAETEDLRAMFYLAQDDNGVNNVFGKFNTGDGWGEQVQISNVESPTYVESFSAAMDDAGTVTIAANVRRSQETTALSDLVIMTYATKNNLTVLSADYERETNTDGVELAFYAQVKNNTPDTLDAVKIRTLDSDGNVLKTSISSVDMASGETCMVYITCALPTENFDNKIIVKVTPLGGTDPDESDNSCEVIIYNKDVSIEEVHAQSIKNTTTVYAAVVNRGNADLDSVHVTFHLDAPDGEVIGEQTVQNLEPASAEYISLKLDYALAYGTVVYVIADNLDDENLYGNNSDFCAVLAYDDITAITVTPEKLDMKTGETAQLTYSVTPADSTAPVSFTSSDTKVATVDANGLVTAIGAGQCTITVSSKGGVTAAVTVSVTGVTGDCNNDGSVNLKDLIMLKRALIGSTDMDGINKTNADLSGDGSVSLIDLLQLKRTLAGIEE